MAILKKTQVRLSRLEMRLLMFVATPQTRKEDRSSRVLMVFSLKEVIRSSKPLYSFMGWPEM